jgi:hypothetical protein
MNFLRTFFIILLLGLGLAVGGLFLGREVVLYMAASQVARDAQAITQLGSYQKALTHCLQGGIGQTIYDGTQLRFTDDRHYVLEIRCMTAEPWQWQTGALPWGVIKTVGTAGFRYDSEQRVVSGEITVQWLNESKTVRFVNGQAQQRWGASTVNAPVVASSCRAYGQQCCDATQTVGQGTEVSEGVTDCPGSCFSTCQRRPLLVSFQSDPPADYATRVVPVTGSSALVLFSYAFDEGAQPLQTVTITYGDGTQDQLTAAAGQVSKQYTCNRFPCRYTVSVAASDAGGVAAVNNRLSTLIVEMKSEP